MVGVLNVLTHGISSPIFPKLSKPVGKIGDGALGAFRACFRRTFPTYDKTAPTTSKPAAIQSRAPSRSASPVKRMSLKMAPVGQVYLQ